MLGIFYLPRTTRRRYLLAPFDGPPTRIVPVRMVPRGLWRRGAEYCTRMSGQDLETVRELSRAFNERREDWVDFYDAEAEVHVPPGWLEGAVYSGHDGVQEVAALWTDRVDEYRWDIEELIDAGDSVVGFFRFSSRMRNDGDWLAPPLGAVFYFRDGKVAKILTYFSWAEALAAAGVEQ